MPEVERKDAPPPPPPAATRGKVLVATDGVEFQSLIGEVLRAEGYHLKAVKSGEEAWQAIQVWHPRVALFDVALPGVPAFELCDRVRAAPRACGMGLILIASVFQQTRYKRAPTSLYGADDYIEKHHISDWLSGKVEKLMAASAAAGAPPAVTPPAEDKAPKAPHHHEMRITEQEQETLIREEFAGPKEPRAVTEAAAPRAPAAGAAGDLKSPAQKEAASLRESLKRYARIIVSDIALYNQDLVEKGIREGTFYQVLKKELEEGRRLYLTRVPPEAGEADHYLAAVREFIEHNRGKHPGAPRGKGGA